ncbi:MAG: hypothetical protein P8171_16215 [Candidatus Thiodiazotropha sp.]
MNHHNPVTRLFRGLTRLLPHTGAYLGQLPPIRRRVILQESPLAGYQYHRAPAIWPFLQVGESLHLRREPTNRHDRYAETTIVRLLDEERNPWRKIRLRVAWIADRSLG